MNVNPRCFKHVTNEQFNSEIEQAIESFLHFRSLFDPGEACDAFNPILKSGPFILAKPPIFVGDFEEAHRAHFVANVLYRIAHIECGTVSNPEKHPIGWLGLNTDAKGWCVCMLTCLAPSNMTEPALWQLLQAKAIIGRLFTESGYLPMVSRDQLFDFTPSSMIDKGISVDG